MDTKRSFNTISEGIHFIYTNVDHFSIHKVTLPTPEKNCLLCCTLIIITGYQNLVNATIYLQLGDSIISKLKLRIAPLCLILDIPRKIHMALGQMDLLNYKVKKLKTI